MVGDRARSARQLQGTSARPPVQHRSRESTELRYIKIQSQRFAVGIKFFSRRHDRSLYTDPGDMSCYFRLGGNSFSSFCMALSILLWFFCGSLLGLMVFVAWPVQTNCFAAESYRSRTRVPTSIFVLVAVAEPMAVSRPGERKRSPMPVAFHCFCRSTATRYRTRRSALSASTFVRPFATSWESIDCLICVSRI